MKKSISIMAMMAVLAACGGGDPEEEDVVDPVDVVVDEDAIIQGSTANVGDLEASSYDADAGTLSVTITLDADTETTEYTPDGQLVGYDRFFQQDELTDRYYVGLAKESTDGSVQATVVQDGGQFNRFFGGAVAEQINYAAPDSGLASYAGDYVGLLNFGPPAAPSGGDSSLDAGTPTEVTGKVFLVADFNDNNVNGSIYNREADLNNQGDAESLPTVVLTVGTFSSDGTFSGTVELENLEGVGSYGGVFGGDDAASAAGVVNLSGPNFLEGVSLSGGGTFVGDPAHNEYGIFVIDQCPNASGSDCVNSEGIDE